MQRLQVIGERRALVREPGENSFVALKDHPFTIAEAEPSDQLVDEQLLAGRIEGRGDFCVIVDAHRDQRQVAPALVAGECHKIGKSGQCMDETARLG